jgi:hypothetical protein
VPLLVDTSVWIDHLRRPELVLAREMRNRSVRMHRFVLAEITLGSLKGRAATIAGLAGIRLARDAHHAEVMELIEREHLYGIGIGYVDAHLLASTLLTPETRLWTRDKRLHAAAERLGIAAKPVN